MDVLRNYEFDSRTWKAHLSLGILPTAVPRPGHSTVRMGSEDVLLNSCTVKNNSVTWILLDTYCKKLKMNKLYVHLWIYEYQGELDVWIAIIHPHILNTHLKTNIYSTFI